MDTPADFVVVVDYTAPFLLKAEREQGRYSKYSCQDTCLSHPDLLGHKAAAAAAARHNQHDIDSTLALVALSILYNSSINTVVQHSYLLRRNRVFKCQSHHRFHTTSVTVPPLYPAFLPSFLLFSLSASAPLASTTRRQQQ